MLSKCIIYRYYQAFLLCLIGDKKSNGTFADFYKFVKLKLWQKDVITKHRMRLNE